jgi:group I intron endonuclease
MVKNLITNECYIGQSTKPYRRRTQHFSIHSNPNTKYTVKQLQSAMRQYGPESFIFGIIEHCEPELLLERETISQMDLVQIAGARPYPINVKLQQYVMKIFKGIKDLLSKKKY